MDETIKELIAIEASVGTHCQPCLKYHLKKAAELGVDPKEVRQAIEIGQRVEKGSMAAMKKFSSSVMEKYTIDTEPDDTSREET
jgi:AhpD family alkylhydroperoxidase